jgi:hypothetical protein
MADWPVYHSEHGRPAAEEGFRLPDHTRAAVGRGAGRALGWWRRSGGRLAWRPERRALCVEAAHGQSGRRRQLLVRRQKLGRSETLSGPNPLQRAVTAEELVGLSRPCTRDTTTRRFASRPVQSNSPTPNRLHHRCATSRCQPWPSIYATSPIRNSRHLHQSTTRKRAHTDRVLSRHGHEPSDHVTVPTPLLKRSQDTASVHASPVAHAPRSLYNQPHPPPQSLFSPFRTNRLVAFVFEKLPLPN